MRIDASDLVHEYPNGTRALGGVSLVLEGLSPIAIVGQNGSGKTTFAKHLNGILRPTSGTLLVDGVSIDERTTAAWAHESGYVFQNPDDQLFLASVREELRFGAIRRGLTVEESEAVIDDIAALCGLSEVLDEHPYDLSPSDKKFCAIGAVLSLEPGLVILDEPTSGQDVRGRARLRQLLRTLRDRGVLCVTISHDMKFVADAFERVIVFASGQVLADGTPHDVFADASTLARTFVAPPPVQRVAAALGLDTSLTVPELLEHLVLPASAEKGTLS